MRKLMVVGVFWGLAALLLALAVQTASGQTKVEAVLIDSSGSETPLDQALYINGFNISDLPGIPLKDFYTHYQRFLAEPISSFDGNSQWFRFGRVTYNRSNAADWQLELANSGWSDLEREGHSPSPGSNPHIAVRDLLISEQEVGVDIARVYGRVISDPLCDRKTMHCIQWTDKQRLEFDQTATTAQEVTRAPLGLWLTHPRTRTTEVLVGEPTNPLISPFAIGAGVMFVIGTLMLMRRSSSSSLGAAI